MKNNEKKELLQLLEAKDLNFKYKKFYTYYFQDKLTDPHTGLDISRDKYPKQLQFFKAGAEFKERAAIAPNRTGKTDSGGFETVCHFTKDYPDWWEGYRMPKHRPIIGVVVGRTNLATRNVTQKKLLGEKRNLGTGMFPHAEYNNGIGISSKSITSKTGTAEGVLDAWIKDKYGQWNQLIFLSREMDSEVIMGMELDWVWFDEDDESDHGTQWYTEALARTATTNGRVISTFTPWPAGVTEGIARFMPDREIPKDGIVREDGKEVNRFCVNYTLEDTPHMTEEQKEDMLSRYVGRERDARCFGIPALGAGAVYPIALNRIVVPNFAIPDHWPRAYGLDYGWRETAAVWVSKDPQTGVYYVYGEYHQGETTPYVHVEAIKNGGDPDGGDWIPGIDDPSGGFSMKDGDLLRNEFTLLGLNLSPGSNSLAAGITKVLTLLESGRLKIMDNCVHLQHEYSRYRYDDHGKVAREQDDHELDALRYALGSFDYIAKSKQEKLEEDFLEEFGTKSNIHSGRDKLTGY